MDQLPVCIILGILLCLLYGCRGGVGLGHLGCNAVLGLLDQAFGFLGGAVIQQLSVRVFLGLLGCQFGLLFGLFPGRFNVFLGFRNRLFGFAYLGFNLFLIFSDFGHAFCYGFKLFLRPLGFAQVGVFLFQLTSFGRGFQVGVMARPQRHFDVVRHIGSAANCDLVAGLCYRVNVPLIAGIGGIVHPL